MKEEITYSTTQQTQIYLNSSHADVFVNGTMKSFCVFFFADMIELPKNAVDIKISVPHCQIPISYYLINNLNNQINISGLTYTFTNGNYTATSFCTLFASLLGGNWSISINSTTNTFKIVNSTNDFIFDDIGINSIFEIMGFESGSTYTSTNKVLISPFPYNFSGINRINIKTSGFKTQNFSSKKKSRCRTIASVPIYAGQSGICFYNNITQFKTSFKLNNISSISIELKDDNNNLIDFQNQNWTICLQLDITSEEVQNLKSFDGIYETFQQEYE